MSLRSARNVKKERKSTTIRKYIKVSLLIALLVCWGYQQDITGRVIEPGKEMLERKVPEFEVKRATSPDEIATNGRQAGAVLQRQISAFEIFILKTNELSRFISRNPEKAFRLTPGDTDE